MKTLFFITLAGLCMSARGFAAQEAHFWHALPAALFNFVVLMGAFVYFARKPIQEAFSQRAADIERTVKKNNELYTKTLEEFDRYGKQTESLKDERQELIEDGFKEGQRLVERARKSAIKTVETYNEEMSETIELETAELRRRLALDLLDLSMKKLTQELRQSSSRLDHFYVDQFKKDGNKANLTL